MENTAQYQPTVRATVADQLHTAAQLAEGARPRLLDEWQVEPELWNQVRRAVDAADQPLWRQPERA